jgi:hypothetical protein
MQFIEEENEAYSLLGRSVKKELTNIRELDTKNSKIGMMLSIILIRG